MKSTACTENSSTRSQISGVASLLANAERPVVVAGFGVVAAGASAALLELARRLPCLRIASTPRAKGALSERHPAYLGVVGFAGQPEANQYVFERADWVVIVGSRLGEMTSDNWDPRWAKLNLIRIDMEACTVQSVVCPQVSLIGDARAILDEVVQALDDVPCRSACPSTTFPTLAPSPDARLDLDARLTPLAVMQTVNAEFPDQGHVFCGIGNTMAWAIHTLRRTIPNRWHLNLNSGAMGHALPGAIGAALLGAPTLALLGDAELLMSGFELHTAVENDLPVIAIVLNDEGHGMVRQGSLAHCAGMAPIADFSRPVDLVHAARAQGVAAARTTTARALGHALSRALCRVGPTLIEVPIERCHVPPMGARLASLSQAFGLRRQE